MRNPIICLTCNITYRSYDDPRLRWVRPDDPRAPSTPPPTGRSRRQQGRRLGWLQKGYSLHCENGHLMPGTDGERNELLVLSIFGEVGAAKGTLVRTMEDQLSSGQLVPHGISGGVRADQIGRLDSEYPRSSALESTKVATAAKPRRPLYFDVKHTWATGTRTFDVAIFDTAGEDPESATRTTISAPFSALTDVFVFAVPPACLPGLPRRVRHPAGVSEGQNLEHTVRRIKNVVALARDRRLVSVEDRRRAVVIVALTKCDRYANVDGFPRELLRDRPYGFGQQQDIAEQIASEQGVLNEFIIRYGGLALLAAAADLNGTVSLHAISGTGNDDPARAPAQLSAPNRSLDPIVVALLRDGMGAFGGPEVAR